MGFPALLLVLVLAVSPEVGEIRSYVDRGMLKTARLELDEFLKEHPESPEGQAVVAELALRDGDVDAAEAAARKAVELCTAWNTDTMMLWARARFEQGLRDARTGKPEEAVKKRFEQAEAGFRRVSENEPDHPDVLWWIARTKAWQGYSGVAEQLYEAQIENHPDRPGGYLYLARLLASRAERTDDGKGAKARKLYWQAISLLDRGLKEAGEDPELLGEQALLFKAVGDAAQARDALSRSVLADPDHVESWNRLQKTMDEEELRALMARALSKRPAATWPAWRLGYYTSKREPLRGEKPWTKYEEALAIVLPALERNGDHEELHAIAVRSALALIGETPKRAKNAKVAVDAFKRIHAAYAWSADSANNLGFYYREVRKYRDSLAWYLKAVERAPENQDILNDTGLIYLFHFPNAKAKGLPYFLKTVALVREGDQKPERGYWDALENLCKHYWEVDRQPEKVIEYARMRYEVTKGVKPYNMSRRAAEHARLAKKALGQ